MKKRCYFIGVPLERSALSSHFQALGEELVRRGNEAVIIAPKSEDDPNRGKTRLNVLAWPSARPTGLRDAVFLWRLIRTHEPVCLIAHFAPVNWMCLIGWMRRVPCRIAWYHTLSKQINLDSNLPPWKLRLLRDRKRLAYTTATHLAVNSEAARLDAGRIFRVVPEKCKVWRNSLADPASWWNVQKLAFREDLVVCAGRFDRTKGQDILVEALGLCASLLPTTRFEFLGKGPLLDTVRHRAEQLGVSDRCCFRGTVAHDEVLRRMACARLTIVPSRTEAFGLVNIESMAVGTPLIASDVDGIREIVRDGVDGVLIPPDDPQVLAKQLVTLLHDVSRRDEMARQARQRFLETYEQSKVVTEQANWLEHITGTEPRASEPMQAEPEAIPGRF